MAEQSSDTILVTAVDGAIRRIPIRGPEMTIGRDADNDLVLDDVAVSRHHVRLRFDGQVYRVTDLNSTNGTYLGSVRLLPGVAEVWRPGTVLQIGDCSLRIERASVSPVADDSVVQRPAPGPEAAQKPARIALFVESEGLQADPGTSVALSLTVLNQGAIVDHFQVSVTGLPAGWVSASPVIRLLPGARQEVSVTILPPRSPESRAGSYAFQVRVASRDAPDEVAEAHGSLVVTPYRQFDAELRPQRGSGTGAGAFRLHIRSRGNADLAVRFDGVDPEEACDYAFEPARAVVPPGGESEVRTTVRPKAPLSAGPPKTHPFTISVRPDDAPDLARQVRGEWVQLPPPIMEPQKRPQVGCGFALLWALLTMVGGTLGGTAGLLVNLAQPTARIGWAVVGACIGLLQCLALQRHLSRSGLWVAANVAAWAVSGPLTAGGTLPGWAVAGVLIAVPQWLVLTGQVRRAGLWIPVAALGWALGGYLAGLSGLALAGPFGWTLAWAAGSALCGAVTGLPMMGLVRSRVEAVPA